MGLKTGEGGDVIVIETLDGPRTLTKKTAWGVLQEILSNPRIPHDVVTAQAGVTPDLLLEQGCDVASAYLEQEYGGFAGAIAGEGKRRLLNFLRGVKE